MEALFFQRALTTKWRSTFGHATCVAPSLRARPRCLDLKSMKLLFRIYRKSVQFLFNLHCAILDVLCWAMLAICGLVCSLRVFCCRFNCDELLGGFNRRLIAPNALNILHAGVDKGSSPTWARPEPEACRIYTASTFD